MKRLYFLIPASVLICVLSLLTFSACSKEGKLTEFKQKLLEENNYQITLTIEDFPILGKIRDDKKIDGNISYGRDELVVGDMRYIEETDVEKYFYKKYYGKWQKVLLTEENKSFSELDYIQDSIDILFNQNNYEKIKKNVFELKKGVGYNILGPQDENDYFIESAVVTVNEDSCVFEIEAYMSSIYYKMTVVFSEIGNINLTLPEVS